MTSKHYLINAENNQIWGACWPREAALLLILPGAPKKLGPALVQTHTHTHTQTQIGQSADPDVCVC